MHSFKDRHGVDWDVSLTYAIAEKFRARSGIDLMEPDVEQDAINLLRTSTRKLSDLAWLICKPKATERGIVDGTDDEGQPVTAEWVFFERFEGSHMNAMCSAMRAEIHFFIQSLNPAAGQAMQKMMQLDEKIQQMGVDKVDQLLQDDTLIKKLTISTDKAIQKALAKMEADMEAAVSANSSGTPAVSQE